MLSIIISSYKSILFAALEKNIAETCGVAYEIIKIDNPGIMGICEAYNKGAEKAKFENLLFLHEDVEFHTKNWGDILKKYFNLKDLGVLGLAGSKRKFHLPYGFVNALPGENYSFVTYPGYPENVFKNTQFPFLIKVIDGVFIGMKKSVWKKFRFNEEISGFHFYDIDISLRTSESLQNYLVNDICVDHFSAGNFGNEWIDACISFNKRTNYPYDAISPKEQRDVRNYWYGRLSNEKISFGKRLKYALRMGVNKDTIINYLFFVLGIADKEKK